MEQVPSEISSPLLASSSLYSLFKMSGLFFSMHFSNLVDCYCYCCFCFCRRKNMVFKGQDAWRNHRLFQGLWKSPFPGFRNAVVIYGVYLGAQYAAKAVGGESTASSHH
jgi:hypothetical protein